MDHPVFALTVSTLLLFSACSAPPQTDTPKTNPILEAWHTPFEAPPFDVIHEDDFLPAFEEAMSRQNAEIENICANPEEPGFENTIEALEFSGEDLSRVHLLFINLNEAAATPGLQEIARKINPELARHQDRILMNPALFERIRKVYDNRDTLTLSTEQMRLLEKKYRDFVRGGALADKQTKARLEEINSRLSTLKTQFGENLLKEMNAVSLWIEDESDLEGLPQAIRDSAAALARENDRNDAWAFNLQRTSWTPFLQYSRRPDLRKKIYEAYTSLCSHGGETDNTGIASEIAALRAERAHLLGYPSHAAYVLEENMARTPEAVNELLGQLWPAALKSAISERDQLSRLADQDKIEFSAADWWYYAEKLRSERYAFDEETLRPYLQLNRVRQAVFDVAGKLWGLQFVPRTDVPVYHPDVDAWEVKDRDGETLGLLYTDYFAREGKRGGAWMENFRQQWIRDGKNIRPIIVNVGNFSKPTGDQPALLSLDEASTVFHEFGHAMHGMLAQGHYPSLSGTNVARDFVEFPSQMMENWAFAPEVMESYAIDDKGEAIPEELIEKLQKARKFNQGFNTTEYLAASILDMDWHTIKDETPRDAMAFEADVMTRIGIIPEIAPRYRTPYFSHIFSGGYSAGYYSYVWAEVLDADAFEAFRKAGIFNAELAEKYRKYILEMGDAAPPMELYREFRGSEPSIDALLERRGLNQ